MGTQTIVHIPNGSEVVIVVLHEGYMKLSILSINNHDFQ